ncbi:hypothetical protein BC938DRAFT_471746 [Jimgerdemannia flammicorona]|uniref:F-box domain-containing protein n=1 Tax=Jimgerdemannia flammicorona TaxID=994334 RepID=A0A433Q7H6_9FUNG|nr:hypothetical protein BC938DRAFT_471746 [Jimgerdemannia flammicorona]
MANISPTLATLPQHILETLISSTDPATWVLVSRQFAFLASTTYVKCEWLAFQSSQLPPEPAKIPSRALTNRYGMLNISDAEITPSLRGEPNDWANAFTTDCEDGVWHQDFRPGARNLIPKAPLHPRFLNLATLQLLHVRHPTQFQRLRNFLLVHAAYWFDEEATLFCLDHGACVDYARGWVLARFACDHNVYRSAIVRALLLQYEARLRWEHFNRGATNVLGAVLVRHSDVELARWLVEKEPGLLDENGWMIIEEAVKSGNTRAVRLLLEVETMEEARSIGAEFLKRFGLCVGFDDNETRFARVVETSQSVALY